MTPYRVVAHNERAGLFRAGPFKDTTALGWVRGFEVGVTERNWRSRLV
jgi:hypothetical protein